MSDSRSEIENLLYIYGERIDLGDLEGVAELFAHASIVAPVVESKVTGTKEVLDMYQGSTRLYEDNGTPHTKHVITNPIIEIDEAANTAKARSYFTVFQALEDFPLQPIIAGRYHDTFERRDAGWRFAERIMLPELFGDLSRHLLFNAETIR